ncbi:MAG: hypothetical protein LAP21_26030, partial [Acidobacteriia bacterium]|nr:hypothetical protein [Terriglobia bacterium]
TDHIERLAQEGFDSPSIERVTNCQTDGATEDELMIGRTIEDIAEDDAAAYERMGCEELLTKKTSPALLDLALQERRDFEYDRRGRGE